MVSQELQVLRDQEVRPDPVGRLELLDRLDVQGQEVNQAATDKQDQPDLQDLVDHVESPDQLDQLDQEESLAPVVKQVSVSSSWEIWMMFNTVQEYLYHYVITLQGCNTKALFFYRNSVP